MEKLNLDFVKLAGITLVVTLAISLGVGKKAAQAQTLFGLAHEGNAGVSTLYTIDTSDGTATEVGPIGLNRCSGMDFDASGTLFAVCKRFLDDTHVLVRIDPDTGDVEDVVPTGIESAGFTTVTDISFRNSNGVLFGIFKDELFGPPDTLGTINLSSSVNLIQGFDMAAGNGLAFSPNDTLNDTLFHASSVFGGAMSFKLRTLDPDGNIIAQIGLVFSPPGNDRPRINAMDFDPRTRLLFASLNDKFSKTDDPENYLAIVNTTSGDVHIVGPTVDGLDAIAFGPEAAAPQAELSDFKCYDVKGPKRTHFKGLGTHFRGLRTHFRGPKWASGFEEVEVTLADEFSPESTTRVGNAEVFCTPVSKDGAEITATTDTTDTTDSFTCYNIKDVGGQPNKEQDVVVGNEFGGQQTLTLKIPKLLCVPSTVLP